MTVSGEGQRAVTRMFEQGAGFWDEVYAGEDVFSSIHRHRLALAFDVIDRLRLPEESAVLDIGGGAGFEAVELARRGFLVTVVDPAGGMLRTARERCLAVGLGERVRTVRGDAHQLGFPSTSFRLVVALGVVPWLHSPGVALREAFRVLRPGGWLLVNADNVMRLNRLLDPRYAPVLSTVARKARDMVFGAPADQQVRAGAHTRGAFIRLLMSEGFEVNSMWTYGFGPFTMLGRPLLRDARGRSLDGWLTERSERGAPLLVSLGAQFMALAHRPAEGPA